MLLLLVIHFIFSPCKRNDTKLLLLALIGAFVDQALLMLNIIEFTDSTGQYLTIIPSWLVLLWISLVLCFNHSLAWLTQRPWWQLAIIGAISGPLSYYGGLTFGAFTTNVTTFEFIATYALIWLVLLPVLVELHALIHNLRFDRNDQKEAKP